MTFSLISDIQSAFESFFVSFSNSITFNLIFILGIAIELFFVALFAVLCRYSYEARMRRSLDTLNRWLFKYRTLDRDNIKEFSSLIKKAPKRLVTYWQQYILYRDKAPSEYMSAENIVEKPLRTSSFASNLKSFVYISVVWSLIVFSFGMAFQNLSDTIINATMLVNALIVPTVNALICTLTVIIMRLRKNTNLDELYQNLHLFDRFIDNACVSLPAYIDYSLLFTAQEIDRGIPALREYLEARARKEKEEFDRIAEQESMQYEKYDFSALGIDGQNILERAMKESESYLTRRDNTNAKIAQSEASLESEKRNFENIQKDYQKKMQTYKENIDRLRQQQEETTNRIENNYLRKQQSTEIAKQEREQEQFEKSKTQYLSRISQYEEAIKALKDEMSGGKAEVEEIMMSEYETFYSKLFSTAVSEAEKRVKEKLSNLSESNHQMEEDLTNKEVQLKRVIDENETLKRKLGIDNEQIEIESSQYLPKVEPEVEEDEGESLISPDEISKAVQEKSEQLDKVRAEGEKEEQPEPQPFVMPVESEEYAPIDEFVPLEDETSEPAAEEKVQSEEYVPAQGTEEEYVPSKQFEEEYVPAQPQEEYEPVQEQAEQPEPVQEHEEEITDKYAVKRYSDLKEENEFEPVEPLNEDSEKEEPAQPESAAQPSGAKRRGRPRKGEEKKIEERVSEKRPRGRPRKATNEQPVKAAPKKRGRPAGSTKKPAAQPAQKRGRGRPRKTVEDLQEINKRIDDEQKRLTEIRSRLNSEIEKALSDLEENATTNDKREEIINEITSLKANVENAKNGSSRDDIEAINKKIEQLFEEIKKLNS